MPRQGRVVLPNYPLHVVQRGHNRQVVFAEDEDYQRYLSDLRDLKDAFGIKVYAFCSGQPIPDSGLSFSSATA
ncbi:transposase, partial [Pseudomonas aeruginosa]|uniref:transposase n=3 Tax=Pseudomonas aeruginosa TaxID=287 RepID=UPI003967DD58